MQSTNLTLTREEAILLMGALYVCDAESYWGHQKDGPNGISHEVAREAEKSFILKIHEVWPELIEDFPWIEPVRELRKEGKLPTPKDQA